jgi:hypothetical protein
MLNHDFSLPLKLRDLTGIAATRSKLSNLAAITGAILGVLLLLLGAVSPGLGTPQAARTFNSGAVFDRQAAMQSAP